MSELSQIVLAYFAWPDIDMDSAHLTIPGYLIDGLMDIEIGGKFAMAHQMQTYAAYMNTLSKSQITKYKAGYENTVNCPVDIEVYDSTGALVGRIVDNVIDEDVANGENAIVMDVDGDSKSFWLPSNEEFTVKLIGNDEGTMDYTVATVDSDTGETERVNFFDVEITDGKTMTGEVTSEDFAVEDYTLELENGETLEPTEKVNAEEAQPIEITVTTDGNGLATESMSVKSGDYVTLNATPDEGNEFVGWYADGKLVSTDMTYSFVAKEDVTFTAKFKETETEIKLGDVNADGEINSSDALLVLQHTVKQITLTKDQQKLADVNKDTFVNSNDALWILEYAVGKRQGF